ncbi:hypothetical protein ABPG74_006550 [Tetrahymena malaccensis]
MNKKIFKLQEELIEKQFQLEEEYYFQVRETEKYWDRDSKCALKIQSIYKMFTLRQRFTKLKESVIKIQTRFRGFLSRKKFQKKKEDNINLMNVKYFSQQAITIQKIFRGFYQRKFTHDFYARKKFLQELGDQNTRFQGEMNQIADEERIEEKKRQEAQAREEFTQLASNLHHLASTHQIPGVYNPPYAISRPTAFNIEVETHLKATFKANYTWKPPTRKSIATFQIKQNKKIVSTQSSIKVNQK